MTSEAPGRTPADSAPDPAEDTPVPASEATPASQSTQMLSSSRDREALRRGLDAWLDRFAPGTRIRELNAPEGNGASSDTVLLTVGPAPDGLPDRWAVRLAPEPGAMAQFPRYDMAMQADLMRLVGQRTEAPVPPVLGVETDLRHLGAPFLVMAAVDGRVPPDVMPYPFGSWLSEAPAADQRRLQDRAVQTLAAIHTAELTEAERARFGGRGTSAGAGAGTGTNGSGTNGSGGNALRRHLAATGDYYRWVSADGIRSPLLEQALAWLDEHCPDDPTEVLSWGDSRIGNMMFDGFEPVAVLDWEMAGTGPPEIDLGWMVFCHWWFQDMAVAFGLPGMPGFLLPEDAAACYERASGRTPQHLEYYLLYAAVRLGVVMSRMARRQVAVGEIEMPTDPDDTIMHRSTIELMLDARYWP